MARPPEDWDPSEDELVDQDEDHEDDEQPRQPRSATPTILAILGIIGWFLCIPGSILSIVLGRIAQTKAHEVEQSDVLARVAWIGGVVILIGDIAAAVFRLFQRMS